jgi:hypothetical protein
MDKTDSKLAADKVLHDSTFDRVLTYSRIDARGKAALSSFTYAVYLDLHKTVIISSRHLVVDANSLYDPSD